MKIRVLDERCTPEQHGDWCDLKAYVPLDMLGNNLITNEYHNRLIDFKYVKGTIFKVSLGVAMEIPEGYHAQIVPRSSTRKNYGVILANSIGVIDNAYCGNEDIWMAEFYAVENGTMRTGDRILQFRIVKNGDPIEFEYVDNLEGKNRGGFGSTGK